MRFFNYLKTYACHIPSIILLIIASYLTYYYIRYVSVARINSDGATYYMLAMEMLKSGSLFPDGWRYQNHDLMLAGKPVIIALLNNVGIEGFRSYQLTNILLVAAAIILTYLFLRSLSLSKALSIIGSSIVILPYSDAYMHHVHDIGSYFVRYIHLLLLLTIIVKAINPKLYGWKYAVAVVLFTIFACLVFFENPNRYLIYFVGPAVISGIYLLRSSSKPLRLSSAQNNIEISRIAHFTILILISYAAALIAHNLADLPSASYSDKKTLISITLLPQQFGNSVYGLMMLFGIDWNETRLGSLSSAVALLKVPAFFVVVLAPIIFTLKHHKSIEITKLYILIFTIVGFISLFYLYTASDLQLYGQTHLFVSIRYLLPFFIFVLICNVILFRSYHQHLQILIIMALMISIFDATRLPERWRKVNHFYTKEFFIDSLVNNGLDHEKAREYYKQIREPYASKPGIPAELQQNDAYIFAADALDRELASEQTSNDILNIVKSRGIPYHDGQMIYATLKQRNILQVYAPYWDSYIHTLLSDSQINAIPVRFSSHGISFYPMLASINWYGRHVPGSPLAFLIPTEHSDSAKYAFRTSCLPDTPKETITIGEYNLIVYEWDDTYFSPVYNTRGRLCIHENSRHTIGAYRPDSDQIVATALEGPGYLYKSSPLNLACGEYEASYNFVIPDKTDTAGEYLGFVDAISGDNSIYKELIGYEDGKVVINFSILNDINHFIQFRAYSNGDTNITLNDIILSKTRSCYDDQINISAP